MPNKPALLTLKDNYVNLGLSITSPTGKIRVKKKENRLEFGEPVSTRKSLLDENCYIEWQIGYDNPDKDDDGVVKEIRFERKGETKYGYELTNILWIGLREGIFNKAIVNELIDFAKSIKSSDFIQENSQISRNTSNQKTINNLNLHIIEEKYPVYLLEKKDYEIDVVVRHKQRAVGYQSMLYVWLPLKNSENSLIGRTAERNEVAYYKINEKTNNFVFDTFKMFSMASRQHNKDILNILEATQIALK